MSGSQNTFISRNRLFYTVHFYVKILTTFQHKVHIFASNHRQPKHKHWHTHIPSCLPLYNQQIPTAASISQHSPHHHRSEKCSLIVMTLFPLQFFLFLFLFGCFIFCWWLGKRGRSVGSSLVWSTVVDEKPKWGVNKGIAEIWKWRHVLQWKCIHVAPPGSEGKVPVSALWW